MCSEVDAPAYLGPDQWGDEGVCLGWGRRERGGVLLYWPGRREGVPLSWSGGGEGGRGALSWSVVSPPHPLWTDTCENINLKLNDVRTCTFQLKGICYGFRK